MSNDEDNRDREREPQLSPVLEEPDAVEIPEAGVGTLFSEDELPAIASRLTFSETMLRLLTSDLKFQDFIREVLLAYTRAVKCEAGSILEINHKENNIFFRASVGHASDRVVKFVIPMGKGIVGHVAESRQPLVISNVTENKIHLKAITDAIGFEARNMVALPLLVRGSVYGVIELLNRVGEPDFTPSDLELLNHLSDLAAKTVEARLMIAWSAPKDEGEAA